jgi:hypothetical protein
MCLALCHGYGKNLVQYDVDSYYLFIRLLFLDTISCFSKLHTPRRDDRSLWNMIVNFCDMDELV